MMFYSKKDNKKIVHFSNCHYVRKIKKDNLEKFNTIEEARNAGYRVCNCCAPIAGHVRKEKKAIEDFCRKEGLSFHMHDGVLIICSPRSKWKIITNGSKKKLFLYHKNENKYIKSKSMITGYHSQAIRKDCIVEYLKYIIQHDEWRRYHPINLPVSKISAPQKGTKRWRKQQTKEKRHDRKMQISNVLSMIESLQKSDCNVFSRAE